TERAQGRGQPGQEGPRQARGLGQRRKQGRGCFPQGLRRRRREGVERRREGGWGWPTIEASAPRPQRRTAPFRCQGRVGQGLVFIRLAMYAIVKTGGKQYRVEEGQSLLVERLREDDGSKVGLEPLLFVDGSTVVDGADLSKVKVEARVVGHERGPKLRVVKFKPKRGYRRRTGHRQELTRLEVTSVKLAAARRGAAKSADQTKAEAAVETKAAVETRAEAAAETKGAAAGKAEGEAKPATRKPATRKSAAAKAEGEAK